MNRAKRYSGPVALTLAVLTFVAGLYLGVVAFSPKPEIRTVIQAPSLTESQLALDLEACQTKVTSLKAEQPVLSRDFSAPSNREGQASAVTPQPYRPHPGRTPLIDPTQDAYYRALLKEGRFPTTGSSEGRPR